MTLTRLLRLSLIAGAVALLALFAAVLVALYLLLQPDRFTAMLQEQAREAGLELILSSPASPTLFPRPALELEGITLTARDANMPILLAANGRMTLPWRTLFGGPKVISRLEINSPRVDLDALQAWLSNLPPTLPDMPMQIPHIATGIRIRGGSVVHGDHELLTDASLDARKLAPDQIFAIDMSAKEPDGTPLRIHLSTVPHVAAGVLQLNDIALRITNDSAASLQLGGSARWRGATGASLQLKGTLAQADTGVYNTALSVTPADEHRPLLLELKLNGKDKNIDMQLPPLELVQWWNQLNDAQGPKLIVPPGDGQIDIGNLDTGNIHIEGLSVQAGNAVPAHASSTATKAPDSTHAAQ